MLEHRQRSGQLPVALLGALLATAAACGSKGEPAPGEPASARAPARAAFGVDIGMTTLDEARGFAAARGITCEDASIGTLMKKARTAHSTGPDAITAATPLAKGPQPITPQVRLSCPGTAAGALGDRARPEGRGRLLFIFDSTHAPLRLVAYQRSHSEAAAARADLVDAVAAMTAAFGEPALAGTLPVAGEPFPELRTIAFEWRFDDLQVRVTALDHGKRGIAINEEVGVPQRPATTWPK